MSNPRNRNPRLVGSVALLVLLSGSLAYGQSTTWARLVGNGDRPVGRRRPGRRGHRRQQGNERHQQDADERARRLPDRQRCGRGSTT